MNLFRELQRRNVFRVGLAYLVGAWLIAQVVQLSAESFGAPDWIMKMLIVFLVIGFPLIVFFSWAYELTPDGLRREADVAPDKSITHKTAHRLDYVTIALVVLAAGFVYWDRTNSPGSQGETSSPPVLESPLAEESVAAPAKAAGKDRSIAVLPFVNMSDDPENEYFADGLSEELLNRLAQLPELRVAGRTSSFEFKGQNLDLRDIAGQLGVAHILEGSVRRSGDRVRITAQLIQATDGSHLWSQTYDRTIDDVFKTQDEIAENVASNLDVLMDDERRALMSSVGVPNVDAFIAYQKGWKLFIDAHSSDDTSAGLARANVFFQQAAELYPGFGNAWYWQADLYQHVLSDGEADEGKLHEAAAENIRVLESAVEHAQTPQQKAYTKVTLTIFSDDWTGLDTYYQRALDLQTCAGPNWSELLDPFRERGHSINKINKYFQCQQGVRASLGYVRGVEAYLLAGRYDEALELADQGIEQLGQDAQTSQMRTLALLALGRHEEATAEADLIDHTGKNAGWMPAYTYAAAGKLVQAGELAEPWLALPGVDPAEKLALLAALGRTAETEQLVMEIDQKPAGQVTLAAAVLECFCGAPFDIEKTPNFKARLEEAGYQWPVDTHIKLPANLR